jgi:hypothetical protein
VIHFVVSAAGSFAMRSYLQGEGQALAECMRVVEYDDFVRARALPNGTWVFGAVDHLCPAEREIVALACHALGEAGDSTILNDPRHVLRRADLLRMAYDTGINTFSAFRPAELRNGTADHLRYPVFVREADRHNGNLSPLLPDRASLEHALASLRLGGHRTDDLLVVEFCDTADADGVFAKYSAFVLGSRILPRYLTFSRHWMIKHGNRLYDLERADMELAFLTGNAHDDWLRDVFQRAHITYGRIDYGLLGGRPQIWEINTNPTLGRVGPPRPRPPEQEAYRARIEPGRAHFHRGFLDGWRALDVHGSGQREIPLTLPPELLRRYERETRERARTRSSNAFLQRLARQRWVRALKNALVPAAIRMRKLAGR